MAQLTNCYIRTMMKRRVFAMVMSVIVIFGLLLPVQAEEALAKDSVKTQEQAIA